MIAGRYKLQFSAGHEEKKRAELLQQMFKSIDPESPPFIEPPFTCDYVSIKHFVVMSGV